MTMKIAGILAALVMLLVPVAQAADLYLMKLEGPGQLKAAREVVDFAYGRMDGRFLVELEAVQKQRLERSRIETELIARDFRPEKFILVSNVYPSSAKVSPDSETVYSSGRDFLVTADKSAALSLRKDGYMVVSLADLKTPLFYNPPGAAAPFADDYPSDSLADLIEEDSLYAYLTRLEAFQTRYYTTDSIISARDWLVDKFTEFGYDSVAIDTFYYNGQICHNVICLKPGVAEPDRLIVIGGHYDSINGDSPPEIFAPGADDNASGTAATLELARILAAVPTRKSIMFAAFSAEEVGLRGSYYLVERLYNQGVDVDFMLNFDMVAYTDDTVNDVTIFSGDMPATADVFAAAAERVTTLIPNYGGQASNSDHASFDNFGYPAAYIQEGDFNFPGWHTDLDISSRLDFPYYAELMRMAAAGIGYIDNAAHLTPIEAVYDFGDGQSLRVVWESCEATYDYKILYGTASGVYTDTVAVPPGECFHDLTGLETGQEYYVTVLGTSADGYGPIFLVEETGTPYVFPRAPAEVRLDLGFQELTLVWESNRELDFNHYRILRKEVSGDWEILDNYVTDTAYRDIAAEGHTEYGYVVTAVDNDANESDSSDVITAVMPTFDWPLLFVDETSSAGGINPSEAEQDEFYDGLFDGYGGDKYKLGGGTVINRSLAGQYGSLVWIDDDVSTNELIYSLDSIEWYLDFSNHFLLGGWRTIFWVASTLPQEPGDFVYDNFGIMQVAENQNYDFIGADGQNGWPDLETRPDNVFSGLMPSISVFQVLPEAEVVLTYRSQTADPAFEGQPVGVLYNTPNGKRLALGFPVYHLTPSSAAALMDRALQEFGLAGPVVYGDVNGDTLIDMLDITFLINYLFKDGPAPIDMNLADVNADCIVDINDIMTMVNYLYKAGASLQYGCVE